MSVESETHPAERKRGLQRQYDLIAIGASWGGLNAVGRVLQTIPGEISAAIVVAQHRSAERSDFGFEHLLTRRTTLPVRSVEDKDPILAKHVFVAPPDYHLLVEPGYFSLSVDERVHHARPSIDVLFESAADAYGAGVIGVILTGANEDGAAGLARIVERGGVAIVQDPESAEARAMPDAALAATEAVVLPLERIAPYVAELCALEAAR
jgi:two-component system, chemotaxis family, protein-glutamate methylesterase/glutaminase